MTAPRTDSTIAAVFRPGEEPGVALPLFPCGVSAGFPSPADDYIDRRLDLNELLIPHPAASFFVRVAGDSMTGAAINDGDLLIVDRSLEAVNGRIVIAVVDGELTVKRFRRRGGVCRLEAENPAYPALEFGEGARCEIWGVVTAVIHRFVE